MEAQPRDRQKNTPFLIKKSLLILRDKVLEGHKPIAGLTWPQMLAQKVLP